MSYPGTVIKQGSTDATSIAIIKKKLNDLGFGPLDLNNANFGYGTEQAVKHFQEANQLLDDGIVGKLTWDRLFSARVNGAVQSKILRIRAVEIVNTQLFVREKTGHNDGREIKQYLASVGLPEGYAWCQALVYWAFDRAAKQLGLPNPVPKTAGVLECLRQAKANGATIIYDNPQQGDQGIMDFGGGHGHTFLVEANVNPDVYTIEGNTNGAGSREGDGIYERTRPISKIKAFIRYV